MMKLLLARKRLRLKATFVSMLGFFLLTACGSKTDKPLIFPGEVLSRSERSPFVGYFSSDSSNFNLREDDTGFFMEGCGEDEEPERIVILISNIPQQPDIHVASLVNKNDGGGYDFYIARLERNRLMVWLLSSSDNIAADYLPQNVIETDGNTPIYPVETMKKFLIDYGEAYTLANEPIVYRKTSLKRNICAES